MIFPYLHSGSVLGSLGLRAGAGLAQRMATRAISVALLLWLTLRPVVRYQWEPVEAVLWLGSLGALLLLLWEGCARVASRLDSSSSLLGWITAVAGTGADRATQGSPPQFATSQSQVSVGCETSCIRARTGSSTDSWSA